MLALLGETPSALSVEGTLGDKEKAQAIHATGVIGRKPIFGAAPPDGVGHSLRQSVRIWDLGPVIPTPSR